MNENPYESARAEEAGDKLRRTSPLSMLATVAAVVVIGGIVVALLLPAVRTAGPAAHRNHCLNNVKQIVLALHIYHDVHKSFPPAYTVDVDGNRLHSWRTLILPYMEQQALYEKIDLTKPWNDPANELARSVFVDTYVCPSAIVDDEPLSTYVAVVGDEAFFPGAATRRFDDLADGSNQTIAVIEVAAERAVHWMSPEDISIDEVLAMVREGISNHSGGVLVAGFADGHADPVASDIDPESLRALLTFAGGEVIGEE